MSNDLTTAEADRDQIRHCFGELYGVADGMEALLNESLDDLAVASARVEQRQAEVDAQYEELRRQLSSLHESQRRLDEVNSRAEQWAGRLNDSTARLEDQSGRELTSELAELWADRERLREQFDSTQAQSQAMAQSLAADLTQARAEFVAASGDLMRERQRLTATETPLHEALAAQIALLEERGSALAATLAAMPSVGVAREPATIQQSPVEQQQMSTGNEGTDAVSAPPVPPPREEPPEAKPAEAEPRQAWSDELAGLRAGLSKIARGAAKAQTAPADAKTSDATRGGEDRALDSVMAQFEMLQNDLSGRRPPERSPRANPGKS